MEKIISKGSTIVKVSDEESTTICRLGRGEECCAFLVLSADGFECIKKDYPNNSIIFSRLENGTMNAKGMGGWKGCLWPEGINEYS